MDKITKREFIDALSSGASVLVGVIVSDGVDLVELSDRLADQDRVAVSYDSECEWRTVTAKRSNHLVFSDDSRLYFDSFADRCYFRDGSALAFVSHERGAALTRIILYQLAVLPW